MGCAIDIGTTTVTMVMADLTNGTILAKGSSGNGQIRYGADVINRIIEQGRPGGRKKLQDAIIKETLTPIMASLCKSAGISARSILRLSVGANTTMNHLFVGVDAASVRMEPYVPSFFSWEGLLAGDLKLPANPLAPVIIAPNIGSYVGGDITAGTLASGIWDKDEMSLFIDLGTNGEIVFGNRLAFRNQFEKGIRGKNSVFNSRKRAQRNLCQLIHNNKPLPFLPHGFRTKFQCHDFIFP